MFYSNFFHLEVSKNSFQIWKINRWLLVLLVRVQVFSGSVVSNSLQVHGLQPDRLLCPWDFSCRKSGVCCHFLLQGIFLTQGPNPYLLCLLHCTQVLYPLSHQGSPSSTWEFCKFSCYQFLHIFQWEIEKFFFFLYLRYKSHAKNSPF